MSYLDFQQRTSENSNIQARRTLVSRRSINSDRLNSAGESSRNSLSDEPSKIKSKMIVEYNDFESTNESNLPKISINKKKSGFLGFGGDNKNASDEEVLVEEKEPESKIENGEDKAETQQQSSLFWRIGSGAFNGVKSVGSFGISATTTVLGTTASAVKTVGSGTVSVVKNTANVVIHPIESVKSAASGVSNVGSGIKNGVVGVVGGTVGAVTTGVGAVVGGTTAVVKGAGGAGLSLVQGTKNIIINPKEGLKDAAESVTSSVANTGQSLASGVVNTKNILVENVKKPFSGPGKSKAE